MVDLTGRVAIVTGAGRGLGREHALLLAKRGARVVVNDLGGSVLGQGQSSAAAEAVAAEIREQGGDAIANASSVTDAEGVAEMVAEATDLWGKVDILVNNAGIVRDMPFSDVTIEDFRFLLEVHLVGAFNCTKAVWDGMVAQRYGRIVMTTSASGLFGTPNQSSYAAAKMGMVGLMQVLSIEGAPHNVRVNALAPTAQTRMLQECMGSAGGPAANSLEAGAVSPAVLALVADDAPNRAIISAGCGSFEQAYITLTKGLHLESGDAMDDAVLSSLDAIGDRKDNTAPRHSGDVVAHQMQKAGLDFTQLFAGRS